LRIAGERFHRGVASGTSSLVPTSEEEVNQKLQWKERCIVARAQFFETPKARELCEKLFAYFVADLTFIEGAALIASVDVKMKMNAYVFPKGQLELLSACLLETFVPGLKAVPGAAMQTAREDWELDRAAEGAAKFFAARTAYYAELEAAGTPQRTVVSTTSQGFATFWYTLRNFASQWQETMTEVEAYSLIAACYGGIAAAKEAIAAAAAKAAESGKKRTGSAGRKR
jgi:hypothetical protein